MSNEQLITALKIVQADANEQAFTMREKIGQVPTRNDWTQERHDMTYGKARDTAHTVYMFCQVRIFQLEGAEVD